jgi:hypothetical protein
MAELSADPAELLRAAAVLRTLVAEYHDQPVTRYWMSPTETGHDELAAALAEFQQVSAEVSHRLPEDVAETAYRLSGIATGYQHTDTALAEQLRRA